MYMEGTVLMEGGGGGGGGRNGASMIMSGRSLK